MLTYRQKHEQANREAKATVVALLVTIAVWIACGFGLSGLDVRLFHTPLWVLGGTVGTWACAIAVSVVLAKRFFVDFDLGSEAGKSGVAAEGVAFAGESADGAADAGTGLPAAEAAADAPLAGRAVKGGEHD